MATDNKTLGRFILDGIPPAPRGIPQIEVSFDIDANGILDVKAKDKATQKEQSIRIEASSGLSKEEIEQMRKDAEVHADEDKKKKAKIEAKNIAEMLIHTSEKTLKEAGDKIKSEDKKEIEEKIAALKKVKDGDNLEEIKKASEELNQAIQKVGAAMYQTAQKAQAEKTKEKKSSSDSQDKKETVEGEYEEVEDKKK